MSVANGEFNWRRTGGDVAPADIERIYRSFRRVRRAEERIAALYPSDKIKSPVHLSIGQEAVSVGVCNALRPNDVVSPTYRGHAAFLAKGGSLKAMFAELYGKATGVAGGVGGSMHLIDMSQNVLGASAVVGTTIPVALGYALALKQTKTDRIVVAFFGDGATEEGVFAECLNFAALRKLPVLFVCENNFYAIHAPLEKRWATRRLCERVETYGIPSAHIEDGDVLQIRAWTLAAAARARRGEGPAFLECQIYRWREHVGPNEDYESGYRDRSALRPWMDGDQLDRLGRMVESERRAVIDAETEQEIDAAVQFAETSPFPEPSAVYNHVFAQR